MNKLYPRALPTLLLALASPLFGCGGAKEEAAVPTSEVKLAASEPPSRFAALGVKATLTPRSAESERWLRELDGALAACLKPALEREPWLQGRMTFALERRRRAKLRRRAKRRPRRRQPRSAASWRTMRP